MLTKQKMSDEYSADDSSFNNYLYSYVASIPSKKCLHDFDYATRYQFESPQRNFRCCTELIERFLGWMYTSVRMMLQHKTRIHSSALLTNCSIIHVKLGKVPKKATKSAKSVWRYHGLF